MKKIILFPKIHLNFFSPISSEISKTNSEYKIVYYKIWFKVQSDFQISIGSFREKNPPTFLKPLYILQYISDGFRRLIIRNLDLVCGKI